MTLGFLSYLWLTASTLTTTGFSQLLSKEEDVIPRIVFNYNNTDRPVKHFYRDGVQNYTKLLLSAERGVLYVGARDAIFSLDVLDIAPNKFKNEVIWEAPEEKRSECHFKGKSLSSDCFNYIKILLQVNRTHVYVCGTYAFSPTCAYIRIADFSLAKGPNGNPLMEDGKGRCPFDPTYKSTAIMVEGELYAGTVSNFQGNEPIISRSLGNKPPLKTENSLNWLQDPGFVGSEFIREGFPAKNSGRDDGKVYFFFSETGKEFDFFENTIVSRIAQVCTGDLGGERVLQKRWTTFLKAQLSCSLPDDGFPFNVIQDMFVLSPGKEYWRNTTFYGVFTSQWYKGGAASSAVCAFSMGDVKRAFNGRYMEVNWETQQWYPYNHIVPEPRPGSCITSAARTMNINSSFQMPDKVLNFAKDHFLMEENIKSQPLLMKKHVKYTQLAVDRVQTNQGYYDVLFVGTENGILHKAINVNHTVHIIEEISLFAEPQPVQNLILDSKQGLLYASSFSGVVQLPVSNCNIYLSCGECVLARDPYCAWDRNICRDIRGSHSAHHWKQDIERGRPEQHCQQPDGSLFGPRALRPLRTISCETATVSPNSFKVLPCKVQSNFATRVWTYNGAAVDASFMVLPDGGIIAAAKLLGVYECWAIEEDFRLLVANYCLRLDLSPEATTLHILRKSNSVMNERSGIIINPLSSESRFPQHTDGKSYWTEFVAVSVVFGLTLAATSLVILYRNRDKMKSLIKDGECSSMQQKKQRKIEITHESLPLNGTPVQVAASEHHRGYQSLNDNHICSTPVLENTLNDKDSGYPESPNNQMNQKNLYVEISAHCPQPRVRIGAEIKDSVV
ncbi:sema domain, immunoglobulin domain (Ig), transmembrane domain (TM) and short cytoplasmic domain, (semaphorin) 4Ba isoform X1 [Scyliorhinus canicula]|uniref:sema domain, immunoglobulin domain (Ig), transmembrane domain (TM) and short cytoplasmic domain, (semaphorin) 4Ba isoform X1 n=1 Tax=Scyliorhinus canicula TaxID=7830 RepID=UPI0018F29E0C|nr:sema domain, immunoglobulin domain (Ig), transmembrane domain (TM) and short cytoplasmic domain, (semaphorin) 4Ba isoform X1 [Scyliorhinus canicula]XP_038669193.1 sema domain, immunoglobulin domain (Ig), transmembrane domain (TM) and short cytoplasmic domain, (semaphorin) 4Ba isoform X1 [Scyliorhinus canicula]XP_038669194.1 sema domain, immunoglobulin domain (Ig), transmembrane domain (TM) and short cytoplasmic domain, (semaphorin) 4Ba isoform X1 [Scyliorhinus canicula]XP_038669195.1 sema dom